MRTGPPLSNIVLGDGCHLFDVFLFASGGRAGRGQVGGQAVGERAGRQAGLPATGVDGPFKGG